jgi:hypothetical protein
VTGFSHSPAQILQIPTDLVHTCLNDLAAADAVIGRLPERSQPAPPHAYP